jgi:hypothetical protein
MRTGCWFTRTAASFDPPSRSRPSKGTEAMDWRMGAFVTAYQLLED